MFRRLLTPTAASHRSSLIRSAARSPSLALLPPSGLVSSSSSSVLFSPLLGQHGGIEQHLLELHQEQLRHKSYVLKFVRGHLPHDLKDVMGIIGCLYDSLPDADEYGAFQIPKEAVDQYQQLGYIVTPQPILNHRQCDVLSHEVYGLANNEEHHPKTDVLYNTSLADLTGGPLFYCQGQWRASWGMHDLIFMPSLTVAASQLLGDPIVRLWYDEVMMKTSRTGPCIPWQQNYARWQHTHPINHCTVLIALDSLTKDRSAPCVIPGSHKWREDGELLPVPNYDPSKTEAEQMNSIWDIVNDEERETLMDIPPVTIDMKRGQAMFLDPSLVYATHGNRSFDTSKCLLIHYIGTQARTVQPGALLPKTTRFAANVPIQGPYFPVCFDASIVEEPTALPGSSDSEHVM